MNIAQIKKGSRVPHPSDPFLSLRLDGPPIAVLNSDPAEPEYYLQGYLLDEFGARIGHTGFSVWTDEAGAVFEPRSLAVAS